MTEKCVYYGARGFVTDTPAAQTAEMLALAEDAVRSPDPVTHYVVSWREGERPTPAQVEEAIDILLDEMQVADHQVIYGVHDDTDNRHVHVVINRVHPDTLKVVKINNGFDIEAAHRAGVRIEQAQGWTVEARKRYKMREDGTLERTDPDAGAKARRPSQTQLDRERRTGEKSAARVAIETAAPLIAGARNWDALHAALAGRGMRYARSARVRTGATLSIGDVTIKAGRVSRDATLRSLEARLGPYQPADPSLERPVEPRGRGAAHRGGVELGGAARRTGRAGPALRDGWERGQGRRRRGRGQGQRRVARRKSGTARATARSVPAGRGAGVCARAVRACGTPEHRSEGRGAPDRRGDELERSARGTDRARHAL